MLGLLGSALKASLGTCRGEQRTSGPVSEGGGECASGWGSGHDSRLQSLPFRGVLKALT